MATETKDRTICPQLKPAARSFLTRTYGPIGSIALTVALKYDARAVVRRAYAVAADAADRRARLLAGWTSVETEGRAITIEGGTKDSVTKAVGTFLEGFPAAGYGTAFNPPYQRNDGTWAASGSRLASCD